MTLSKKIKSSETEKVKKPKEPEQPVEVEEVEKVEKIRKEKSRKTNSKKSVVKEVVEESPFENENFNVESEETVEVQETPSNDGQNLDDLTTSEEVMKLLEKEAKIIRESENRRSKLLKKLKSLVKKETKKSRKKSETSIVKRNQKKRVIIDALADLMDIPRGSELTRQEVQIAICSYIKNNNLKCEDDKNCFDLDEKLERVLGKPQFEAHPDNPEIRHSYRNLMKTLKNVFVPEEPVESV